MLNTSIDAFFKKRDVYLKHNAGFQFAHHSTLKPTGTRTNLPRPKLALCPFPCYIEKKFIWKSVQTTCQQGACNDDITRKYIYNRVENTLYMFSHCDGNNFSLLRHTYPHKMHSVYSCMILYRLYIADVCDLNEHMHTTCMHQSLEATKQHQMI